MRNMLFQSTPPVKAATFLFAPTFGHSVISIHAAREGGDKEQITEPFCGEISIHAAREGGDLVHVCPKFGGVISIHAAREGGDCGNE